MQFSAMTMNMWFPNTDDRDDDNRIIDMAAEQSIWFAELGYHVWFTDHHFRGPWHSNPLQFASYIAPLIPRDRYSASACSPSRSITRCGWSRA